MSSCPEVITAPSVLCKRHFLSSSEVQRTYGLPNTSSTKQRDLVFYKRGAESETNGERSHGAPVAA